VDHLADHPISRRKAASLARTRRNVNNEGFQLTLVGFIRHARCGEEFMGPRYYGAPEPPLEFLGILALLTRHCGDALLMPTTQSFVWNYVAMGGGDIRNRHFPVCLT
jgi:hypothetical protein